MYQKFVLTVAAGLLWPTILPAQPKPYTTWSDYAGGPETMQYSALTQINKENVKNLEPAWSIKAPGPTGRFSFNPLVVGNVMYLSGKDYTIFALDAATGKQIWAHPVGGRPTNRGLNYWEGKDPSQSRLIFAVDGYLQEIYTRTGVTVNTFGNDGKVNLREGLGRDPKTVGEIQSGTPGRVFENLIILGSAPGEMYGSPPGDLRAYNVLTGKLVWQFHTVPHPGEYGYDTWPKDAWKYMGGNNAWGDFSLDVKRGIAYFPLGSPTYDLYGADRIGSNLFGDCLLALDARTGKRLWHFQVVHHDLWDYDPTAGPKLLTVRHEGKLLDVVAQPTKFGFLYVFDRVTGKPLWPIEERPVPKSDMPGEQSWPTQPFPTKPPPFARQKFTLDDVNPYLDPEEQARIKETLRNARNEGLFTPPAFNRDQIAVPGENGGANWGSTAADPATGMVYVKTYDAPTIHKMAENPPLRQGGFILAGTPAQQGYALYMRNCIGCHGPNRERITYPKEISIDHFRSVIRSGRGEMPAFSDTTLTPAHVNLLAAFLEDPKAGMLPLDPAIAGKPSLSLTPAPEGQTRFFGPFGNVYRASNGMIAFSPPWSSIVAYDLNDGTIKWRRPIGTTPGLAEKGITDTGSSAFIRNGPVVTAGGLIFIGTGPDRMVHALDKDTGKTLWESELDASPDGIPAVYQAGGRQFVAFYAAGVARASAVQKASKPDAQGYYVFALPSSGEKK